MTWLGLLNFFVLQWFGVRLARCYENRQTNLRPMHVSLMPDGSFDTAWQCDVERVCVGYRWFYWIWPLTGWWSDFRWIAKRSRWIVRRQ